MIAGTAPPTAVGGLVAGDHQTLLDALDRAQGPVPAPNAVCTTSGAVHARRPARGRPCPRPSTAPCGSPLLARSGPAVGTVTEPSVPPAASRSRDQQRFLDGALVDLVEHGVCRLTVERVVAVGQLALRPGVRDLLDQDHDVRHESGSSSSMRPQAACPTTMMQPPVLLVGNLTPVRKDHHSWSKFAIRLPLSSTNSYREQYPCLQLLACLAIGAFSPLEPTADAACPLTRGNVPVPGPDRRDYWFRHPEVRLPAVDRPMRTPRGARGGLEARATAPT